ncbi:MAG: acetyltransferase [Bacteroidota bacterium]
MKELLIIGARGFGREIYNLAKRCHGYNINWKIKGYLDDKSDALDDFPDYPPIIDSVEKYEVKPEDVFVCALGDVKQKLKYVMMIKDKGGIFLSLVHETSVIYNGTQHGEGLILFPFTHITCNVRIGNWVTILPFSVLGHDVTLGNFCHLNSYSFLGGFTSVGNLVTINTGATIVPGMNIGDEAVIGAGSVVIKNVPPKCTVFGNPARKVNIQ